MKGEGILTACENIAKAVAKNEDVPDVYKSYVNTLINTGYLNEDLTLGNEYWELRTAIINETNSDNNGA